MFHLDLESSEISLETGVHLLALTLKLCVVFSPANAIEFEHSREPLHVISGSTVVAVGDEMKAERDAVVMVASEVKDVAACSEDLSESNVEVEAEEID